MLQIGIIGMGFMGRMHFRNWRAQKHARIVAVCDAQPINTSASGGNIDTGEPLDLDGIAIYRDTADMLASEQLDAVSITLPTFLHKDISIQCLQAGVHVLCEKPMALNVEDCDAMIAVARSTGKHLMVAHCLRFWPEYIWIRDAVRDGRFGKVLAADLSRLSFPPGWGAGSWFTDTSKSGGIALDLHIHDIDYLQYLFGVPDRIHPMVACFDNGVPGHLVTQLEYNHGPVVCATASWMMPKSFGFKMAFEFVFERALVVFDGSVLKVFPGEGEPFVPEIAEGDGYLREIGYFCDIIQGNETETVITDEQARESVRISLEAARQ